MKRGTDKKKRSETKELLELLYPLESGDRSRARFAAKRRKKLIMAGAVLILMILGISRRERLTQSVTEEGRITRPSQGAMQVQLRVTKDELSAEIDLAVQARRLTGAELEQAMEAAAELVEQRLPGKNISLAEVTGALRLVDRIEEYDMEVLWNNSDCPLVHMDGSVNNQNLTEPVTGTLKARLVYGEENREWDIELCILPYPYSEEERLVMQIGELLEQEAVCYAEQEYLQLPMEHEGTALLWKETDGISPVILLAAGMLVLILLYLRETAQLKERVKHRERELLSDYPEFLSRLLLLLGAGMTVRGAWERMAEDEKHKKRKRAVYEEMIRTLTQLEVGMSEPRAYEQFGRRCMALPYLRFAAILNQNLKKGSVRLTEMLQLEAKEAFSERKQQVRQQGEKAGTRLLLPMGGMLLIILVLLLVPALVSVHGL